MWCAGRKNIEYWIYPPWPDKKENTNIRINESADHYVFSRKTKTHYSFLRIFGPYNETNESSLTLEWKQKNSRISELLIHNHKISRILNFPFFDQFSNGFCLTYFLLVFFGKNVMNGKKIRENLWWADQKNSEFKSNLWNF